MVLEAAAQGRPYSAPFRLSLCALAGVLGCPQLATQHYRAIHAKHIQHDTLTSHHLLPVLLGLGASATTSSFLHVILGLFEDHGRDAGDTVMMAYDENTYTKVRHVLC